MAPCRTTVPGWFTPPPSPMYGTWTLGLSGTWALEYLGSWVLGLLGTWALKHLNWSPGAIGHRSAWARGH
jgi:hypothetical protein